MKTLFALLLLHLQINFGFTQQVVVANTRQNVVYCGVDNPLAVAVAGYTCNSVIITTENGKIKKVECGLFNYHPAEPGLTHLKVWVKAGSKRKLAGTVMYRCKLLPLPVAFIGINRGGFISAEMLKRQGGVRAVLLDSDFDAPFMVKSYTATATRDTTVLFTNKNVGAVYNDSLRNNLDLLQPGDNFLVSSIVCVGPDGRDIEITPMEFYIKK